ncbi:hypothetical protein TcBrA4_0037840 [Trypanosoma cruzi]|nr:hypothetical protein TcBrA4_0037840 [Trypanosoma cruzi]
MPPASKLRRICKELRAFSPRRGIVGGRAFPPKKKLRQPFREAQLPHFPSVRLMFCLIAGSVGSGVDADLFRCTIQFRRFSRCLVDARGMPCGGGSARHCFSAKSRMLGSKTPPVVIPAESRRRANCVWHPFPPAADNSPTPKAVNRSIRAWMRLSPTWQELARLPPRQTGSFSGNLRGRSFRTFGAYGGTPAGS